jgi:hypothetical protein
MYVITFIAGFICHSSYLFASAYANGMAKYAARNNNFSLDHQESCWQSVKDETHEFIAEVLKCNLFSAIEELVDVIHASIKMICINILPQFVIFAPYIWYFIFPFVLPVSIKLARRYEKFGCIRNHNRINSNHKCEINDK